MAQMKCAPVLKRLENLGFDFEPLSSIQTNRNFFEDALIRAGVGVKYLYSRGLHE